MTNYILAFALSIFGGWLITGLMLLIMEKGIKLSPSQDPDFFQCLQFWVGAVERAAATALYLLAPSVLPGFIGGWVVLKIAAGWGNAGIEDKKRHMMALMGSVISFTCAISAGFFADPTRLASFQPAPLVISKYITKDQPLTHARLPKHA